jgi:hypothetical protein
MLITFNNNLITYNDIKTLLSGQRKIKLGIVAPKMMVISFDAIQSILFRCRLASKIPITRRLLGRKDGAKLYTQHT